MASNGHKCDEENPPKSPQDQFCSDENLNRARRNSGQSSNLSASRPFLNIPEPYRGRSGSFNPTIFTSSK